MARVGGDGGHSKHPKRVHDQLMSAVQRHLDSTQVRVIQDLDTALPFAMSIQAEVGAMIQDSSQVKDVSRKPGASAQAAHWK
eukprot:5274145-Amphidinium_carterae.1